MDIIDLRGNKLSLSAGPFVADLARYAEGILTEKAVKRRYPLAELGEAGVLADTADAADEASEIADLLERVEKLRDDINAVIDARVDITAATCEGVPRGVIRQVLTHGQYCVCNVLRDFSAENLAKAEAGKGS
jgi:hypothetical protein